MRLAHLPSPMRDGGVTPLTILCLSLLMGVAAIAVDGGTLIESRRHVQAAADAAALAAASDLLAHYSTNQGSDPSGTAVATALANASANGFSNDGVQSTVSVSTSPQNYQAGPNAGKALPAGYVEVIIQYNAGRTFSAIFGSGSIPVRARAVARGQWAPLSNPVTALNLNLNAALATSGSSGLRVNGGIQVNSSSSSAVVLNGTAGLSASKLTLNPASGTGLINSLLSTLTGLLGSLLGPPPTIVTSPPAPDPFRYLTDPDPVQLGLSTQSTSTRIITSGSVDLYPGVYTGGISVSGSATVTLHGNTDGTPGIYYMQGGGFSVSGALLNTPTIKTAANETAGVMIYNNWQSSGNVISVSGQANLSLLPPSSGLYQGISIFQKRGTFSQPAPAITINGQGSIHITGLIYAAHASVNLSGQASANVMAGAIVADTLNISGSAAVTIDHGSSSLASSRVYGLIE